MVEQLGEGKGRAGREKCKEKFNDNFQFPFLFLSKWITLFSLFLYFFVFVAPRLDKQKEAVVGGSFCAGEYCTSTPGKVSFPF